MADVTVTAAEVLPASGTTYFDALLGATVTAGQSVYIDSSGLVQLADADASATAAQAKGIAMTGGAAGQPCRVAISGNIDPGFTVTVGEIYVVSATAGGIAPVADLATGMYPHILGFGTTASNLKIINQFAGVAVP